MFGFGGTVLAESLVGTFGEKIAPVALDLIMPQMEAKQGLEELHSINSHVKVIVSTGRSLDARESLLLGLPASAFVNKPCEVKQMVQTVREVLEA